MRVSQGLLPLIDAFARLRVCILGDAMLDRHLDGRCGRVCPEAPVPVVALNGKRDVPGGAANTAVNAAALGASVTLISTVGDDDEGDALQTVLARDGVRSGLPICRGRRTLCKTRVAADGHLLVRYDQGDTGPLPAACEAALTARLRTEFPKCDAVLVSDYGYGVVTPAVIGTLTALSAKFPQVKVVVDSKRPGIFRDLGPVAVKPNYGQALHLLNEADWEGGRDRAARIAERAEMILDRTGARIAAVTLDVDGALVCERGRSPYRTYARPAPPGQAAGAGDTYAAALALALAADADTPAAAELAAAAAAVVVAEDGTAVCTAHKLRAAVAADEKIVADHGVLAERLAPARRAGKRIVLTNGCFDILHRGHTTYLGRAKALGDLLVVGVNTDESIRRLKGAGRPINTLDDRVQVLAALSCVDLVVPFGEDTPHELVRVVRPNIFVKGGDYTRDRLPEAGLVEALGGEVRLLPTVDDRSTTNVIERIRSAYRTNPELA
jgi:D-beta-D-heptose 7-phosphate kinase/D-beta-D-heptose 1-phosphate adenosyltransferase